MNGKLRLDYAAGSLVTAMAALLAVTGCRDDNNGSANDDTGTAGDSTAAGSDTMGVPQQPPPTPVLVSPVNEAIDVPIEAELCWEPVEDPNGDPVRYRVFVDNIELTEGKLSEEEGHAGPCIGPLNFNYDQDYVWQVSAFTPGQADGESLRSAPFGFRTVPDGLTTTVFYDPFDEDLGWQLGGDALDGHWMRGDPVAAEHEGVSSQPGTCAGGQSCVFTGQNPDGEAASADVQGGTTTLLSPAFDLGGFEAASVQLSRFMYKSTYPQTGTLFRVELLVPDASAPEGYQVFVLEQLEQPGDAQGQTNTWTPTEYAACGVPMVDGARLRLVATDLGEDILEAAVDSVVVLGHLENALCDGGVGSICDPFAEQPCADDLLCCGQGVVNKGVYRCAEAVPSISYPDPGGPPGTMNGPLGCDAPDLFVEPEGMDVFVEESFFPEDSCEIFEGCVPEPGWRRLLRFDTQTPNAGSRDLTMGVPTNHPDLFHFSECHGHYHFDGYAYYELLDQNGDVAATGHKQAFCLIDWSPWAYPDDNGTYSCGNQGISMGWDDVYGAYLDCQYVDITDVPPGDYVLRIGVNLPSPETAVAPLNERNYDNNILDYPVTITEPPPE